MKKITIITSICFVAFATFVASCVKQKADTPTDAATIDPGLKVTGTILQLKNMYNNTAVRIDSDIIIAAVVTADDKGGNFYKQIMIQDSTAGIALLIEKSGLYNEYPVGRKLYVKCKGMYLSAYGNFIQLGYTLDNTNSLVGIPSNLISNYVVKATYPNALPIKHVTLSDILAHKTDKSWVGSIFTIDSNVEFASTDVGQLYAQPTTISSGTDRNIEDCAGKKIVMRNSGYAGFQTNLIPAGRGALTFIQSVYNSTAQILIRDLNDVNFTDSVRCGGVVIVPPANITIDSLRKTYPSDTGSSHVVTLGNVVIHGTVISSYADSNISQASSIYLEDESGRGINVYGISGLALGDSVTINCNANSLIVYKGSMELKKGTSGTLAATKIASGKTVNPAVITVAALNADLANPIFNQRKYESALVKINTATITGTPAFYSGSKTVTDATGNIILYTRNAPPFTTTAIPTGPVNLTAIAVQYYTTSELYIRRVSLDVQ